MNRAKNYIVPTTFAGCCESLIHLSKVTPANDRENQSPLYRIAYEQLRTVCCIIQKIIKRADNVKIASDLIVIDLFKQLCRTFSFFIEGTNEDEQLMQKRIYQSTLCIHSLVLYLM